MNVLKTISAKPLLPLSKFTQKTRFSTKPGYNSKFDAISMSFASYESTQPVEGAAPLMVMHGLFGSKANWNSLCKVFHQKTAPKRKIIAVDARNHGDSPHSPVHSYPHMAEDIRVLLEQLKIDKTALLGHSMGGRAAMYFALKYPDYIDKMIVADISPVRTSPNLKNMPALFTVISKVVLPKNVNMSSARLVADKQLAEKINDKGLRSFLLTNLVQKSDGSYAWRINLPALISNFEDNISNFPSVPGLTFTGPVLFVAGGMSDFIQKTDHPQILKIFPNAEFREIEGAGHWLHSEKPNEFLQICTEFLNRSDAAS